MKANTDTSLLQPKMYLHQTFNRDHPPWTRLSLPSPGSFKHHTALSECRKTQYPVDIRPRTPSSTADSLVTPEATAAGDESVSPPKDTTLL